ncbi:MAG: hypothetical protein HYY23_09780 [Verrucomicrobia bacterium]|nr:hypothetical protein [Verrucomicrobiota bacterium]
MNSRETTPAMRNFGGAQKPDRPHNVEASLRLARLRQGITGMEMKW